MAILGARGHVQCSNALRAAEYPWRSTCCMPNNIWGLPDTPTQPHPTPSTFFFLSGCQCPYLSGACPPGAPREGPGVALFPSGSYVTKVQGLWSIYWPVDFFKSRAPLNFN